MPPFLPRDEFIEQARTFHGCATPGLMIGASMVELAMHSLGDTRRFMALSETGRSLPDAIQLLTPCTMGNGRLHIVELGRFALSLYRQRGGRGVRVWLDHAKTAEWPLIRRWAMHEKIVGEKALLQLDREIRKAGISILSARSILVQPEHQAEARPETAGAVRPCASCGELHPLSAGPVCLACQGHSPYAAPRMEDEAYPHP